MSYSKATGRRGSSPSPGCTNPISRDGVNAMSASSRASPRMTLSAVEMNETRKRAFMTCRRVRLCRVGSGGQRVPAGREGDAVELAPDRLRREVARRVTEGVPGCPPGQRLRLLLRPDPAADE